MKTRWIALFCLAAVVWAGYSPLHAQESAVQARLDSLERLILAEKDPEKKADLLNTLSFSYLEVDAEKTRAYGQQALDLAKKHDLTKEMGRAYNNLANHALFSGDMQGALAEYEKSKRYFEQAGDTHGVAKVLGNIGNLHYYTGNFAKALDYSLNALRMFEQLDAKLGMANQTLTIGSIYLEQGFYDKAIHYDTLALQLYRELNNQNNVALVLGNLANIFQQQKSIAQARDYYLQAIDAYEQIGNPTGVARSLSNLSTMHYDLGEYASALTAQKRALSLFREANNTIWVSYTLANMGAAHFYSYQNYDRRDSAFQRIPGTRQGLLNEAIRLLRSGIELAQQMEDVNAVHRFSGILSEAYAANGDVPNAFAYFKLYTTAKDSLQSIDTKRAIEQLTTEREVELKDKQIELDRLAVEKKRNERLYFGIGIGLLLLSVLFVYRNYDNQKKSNVRLAALNTRIADTNAELGDKNHRLSQTLQDLKNTQEQLVESEKQKENALIRSRISQDIHDDISSGLTKISWLAEAFLAKTAGTGTDVSLLEKINGHARETVAKLGEIIWSSNPERDNLDGLLAYLRKYIRNYMDDSPIRVQINFPETVPDISLSPEQRRNLYLALKEALHNARKYSQASEIAVSFDLTDGRYRFEVADNGVGMQPDIVQGGGNGMLNMQRRLEAIGGHMWVETEPGTGVRVVFEGINLNAPV